MKNQPHEAAGPQDGVMDQKQTETKIETGVEEKLKSVSAPTQKSALAWEEGEGNLAAALASLSFSSRLQLR